jgi:hypothetical protein
VKACLVALSSFSRWSHAKLFDALYIFVQAISWLPVTKSRVLTKSKKLLASNISI